MVDAAGGRASTQEVLKVAATVEVLTTIVTTTALQKLSLPQAAIDTVGSVGFTTAAGAITAFEPVNTNHPR